MDCLHTTRLLLLTAWFLAMLMGQLSRPAHADTPQDQRNATLLDAASRGDIATVKLLLSQGADINTRTEDGNTPLVLAVSQGAEYPKLVNLLLKKGADVHARNNKGETPLMNAVSWGSGHPISAKLLLDHGADATAKDNAGYTALHEVRDLTNSWSRCERPRSEWLYALDVCLLAGT